MPYARHQVRVYQRDKLTHSSGAVDYAAAEERCRVETIAAGVGAIGTVYEFDRAKQGTAQPNTHHMPTLYQVRLAYDPDHADGSTMLVAEDHTTPPPSTSTTHG